MSTPPPAACVEHTLLIQADLDGELDAAAAACLAAHLADCAGCAALRDRLTEQSRALRAGLPRYVASPRLRAVLEAQFAAASIDGPTAPSAMGATPPPTGFRRRPALFAGGGFGAGVAIAAAILLLLRPPAAPGDQSLLASHLRALEPGHLMDVVSTDRHTVKPWFDGRISFSPPVQDFARQGFPLLGGRLDYIGARHVAVLVYGRAKHVIDLYVWPAAGTAPPRSVEDHGYHVISWTQDGFARRAITDIDPAALAAFVALWHPPA